MATSTKGRITSRVNAQKNLHSTTTGLRQTGLEAEREGLLYVPETTRFDKRVPLLVMFHGAGGDAQQSIEAVKELADRTGTIVLAPESQGKTWDLIRSKGFGEDLYLVDEALSDVFALYPIDPKRVAVGGFSDGASYALSVGLTNGDVFTHILAFSPGFFAAQSVNGSPEIFISHGTNDSVLNIDQCGRALVPQLQARGAKVNYKEFTGGHTIPDDVGREAFTWFLGNEAKAEIKNAHVASKESGLELG